MPNENTNLKSILINGGAIFLTTILVYYFVSIKNEVTYKALNLPLSLIELPFYNLAKDIGNMILCLSIFSLVLYFFYMGAVRSVLTFEFLSGLRTEKFLRSEITENELEENEYVTKDESELEEIIKNVDTDDNIKKEAKKELERRSEMGWSVVAYFLFGMAQFGLAFEILRSGKVLDFMFIFIIMNASIMTVFSLYAGVILRWSEKRYLLKNEEMFQKSTFVMMSTILIGSLIVFFSVWYETTDPLELTVMIEDQNGSSINDEGAMVTFNYLVSEKNNREVWRTAQIEKGQDGKVDIELLELYDRRSTGEGTVKTRKVEVDQLLTIKDDTRDRVIELSFKDWENAENQLGLKPKEDKDETNKN